jgi:hypothetical protein
MALRGKPWDNGEGGFLGGARSPRPGGKATRKPRDSIPAEWVNDEPMAERKHVGVSVMLLLRACGARPSAGWAIRGICPLEERSEAWRGGVFFGEGALRASEG